MSELMRNLTGVAYRYAAKPILFKMKPDTVHEGMITFGDFAAKVPPLLWLLRSACKVEDDSLHVSSMGLEFKNPIVLGAGLDKNAKIAACLRDVGFGMATFGSITSRVCEGNEKPWFHRLPEYKSLLVHVGLANDGMESVVNSVEQAKLKFENDMKVSASIARTNDLKSGADDNEAIEDYAISLEKLTGKSSAIEINISCPNTHAGEPFTDSKRLDKLLTRLDKIQTPKGCVQPRTLKMPSDKSWKEFRELVKVAADHNVAGLTIANLRKDRDGLDIPTEWKGNLSGKPTQIRSSELIRKTYSEFSNRFTILGLGGVFTAEDAYEKIRSGATMVELVTSLMFQGPQNVAEIKAVLIRLLKADGFKSVQDAVGVDV
jgi:dihydroorotate dehydrogenase (fumarate)